MAGQTDVILRRLAGRLGQRLALGDHDLGLHDVDAGHFLGDGVFDLHAGVHLDEVELAGIHIHQELDGARAFVIHMRADLASQFADLLALCFGQIGRGRTFHDLLVAALHGTVALEQVVDVALLVAEDLHLDMARAKDHLFKVALAVAEGGLGLAAAFADLLLELLLGHDRAHPTPAAAPGGLEHQRIADLLGLFLDLGHVLAQHLRRGDDGHTRLDRDAARAGLVAKLAHGLGLGADEGDPGRIAGIDEIGVFRQQAVARMDRVGAGLLGDADDLGNAQIGGDRPQPLADAIGLVRFEAVQAQLVLLGKDGDGLFAHFIGGAHDADRDFATVRDEDLLEFGHGMSS